MIHSLNPTILIMEINGLKLYDVISWVREKIMSSSSLSQEEKLACYYDLLYSYKDYKQEAEELYAIIKKYKNSEKDLLLDVACGTAKHLFYLSEYFECMGVDVSYEMLQIARKKLPNIQFKEADMINMRLDKKFDIITCLFSAIGYVKTKENLQKTWDTFALHLKQGGIAIVEPWVTKQQYRNNMPNMVTYADETLKIARANVAKAEGSISILEYHYLIAEKGQALKHFQERHEMGMFEIDETLKMMHNAGFGSNFFPDGLKEGRGIYLGIKL